MYFKRRMTGRVNPLLQLVIFILAICLVVLLGYRQFSRMRGDLRPVVVAAKALDAGTKLSEDNLKVVNKRSGNVPENAAYRIQDVAGLVLSADTRKGKPILAPGAPRKQSTQDLAALIPSGRVLTSLTMKNLSLPARQLKRGDLVDILVSGTASNGQRLSYIAVRAAYVVGELAAGSKSASAPAGQPKGLLGLNLNSMPGGNSSGGGAVGILIALKPHEVLPIAQVDDAGHHITLVLHSRTEQRSGELLTVQNYTPPRAIDVITGDNQKRITVR